VSFKSVFASVFIGTSLIVAAFVLNSRRPEWESAQPTAALVRASGKCAECHRQETAAVVSQFEMSVHAVKGINCLDCHQPTERQEKADHHGFVITTRVTAKNCAQCHRTEYDQYLRSRHAAPAWAAVQGSEDFTEEQIAYSETYHKGAVLRPANRLAIAEGPDALPLGCMGCHSVGKPNADGSIGTCTHCHARHSASIALARQPETCGQCHMGPDHSQIEIYNESKHGVLFNAQKDQMNLQADPKTLSVSDMSVPTCSTCHMSGLEGLKMTHDTSERLSYFLFASISDKRPNFALGQVQMKEVCLKCHSTPHVERIYEEAERVVESTNAKVEHVQQLMIELREEGLLTPEPFDEPIEFLGFDYWHYFGRTAKHGAFMGGADFVQWHGNYKLLSMRVEIEKLAQELREGREFPE